VVGLGWERSMCTIHLPSTSVECEYRKAIYLFQVIPCSPVGTILFATKQICSKQISKLVGAPGFHITFGIHCMQNLTYKC